MKTRSTRRVTVRLTEEDHAYLSSARHNASITDIVLEAIALHRTCTLNATKGSETVIVPAPNQKVWSRLAIAKPRRDASPSESWSRATPKAATSRSARLTETRTRPTR